MPDCHLRAHRRLLRLSSRLTRSEREGFLRGGDDLFRRGLVEEPFSIFEHRREVGIGDHGLHVLDRAEPHDGDAVVFLVVIAAQTGVLRRGVVLLVSRVTYRCAGATLQKSGPCCSRQ